MPFVKIVYRFYLKLIYVDDSLTFERFLVKRLIFDMYNFYPILCDHTINYLGNLMWFTDARIRKIGFNAHIITHLNPLIILSIQLA